MNTQPIRILLLLRSLSKPSFRVLLETLSLLPREQGVITHEWDLYHTLLLIPYLAYYRNLQTHESRIVKLLGQSADQANAFVLGTSAYHNSFSWMLKNALDHSHADQFRHTTITLNSHSCERTAVQSCDRLWIVAQIQLATVLPRQLVTIDGDIHLYLGNTILISLYFEKLLIRMRNQIVEYSLLVR